MKTLTCTIKLPLPRRAVVTSRESPYHFHNSTIRNNRLCIRAENKSNTTEPSEFKVSQLITYLETDLPKLFDKGEVDKSYFEDKIDFQDPITKYASIDGYLFNIKLLLLLFKPIFELHQTYQSGPSEITTRWTMTMDFKIVPWRPQLVFTGLSIYGIDPISGKFNSHIDVWDSIEDQKYFSSEGLNDLLTQSAQFATRLDGFSPRYNVLVRRKDFEVRKYSSYNVAKIADLDFSDLETRLKEGSEIVKRYCEGMNEKSTKVKQGLPILVEWAQGDPSNSKIGTFGVALEPPSSSEFPGPGDPNQILEISNVMPKIVAVSKFNESPTLEVVSSWEKALKSTLMKENLKFTQHVALVMYQSGSFLPQFERMEVHVELEDFDFQSYGRK